MSEERLQKILARAGVASRRKAEELIQEGLVTVNGRVAALGEKADPERDAIKVGGKRIHLAAEHRYLLLNKPKGVLTTVSDPAGRPTVMDLVPPGMRRALVPVGRLDFDTEGLLLLTDDGDFAQRVAHPRYGCTKTYEVKVKGSPSAAELDRLRAGVVLEGRRTAPARITPHPRSVTAASRRRPTRGTRGVRGVREREAEGDNTWWLVELSEGRSRQIREMFYRIGHSVQKLRRIAIGPLRDPHLPVGALRELSELEVAKLERAAARPRPRPGAPRPPGPPGPPLPSPRTPRERGEKRVPARGGSGRAGARRGRG
jgi:23S rRNA pseudouridine2605 synthase